MKIEKIRIEEIKIGKRLREEKDISGLKESIDNIGLLNPIRVDKDSNIRDGVHRLRACEELGWMLIDCIISDNVGLKGELEEIDANLIREDLTVLERAEHLKRRKEIYEELYPERRKGGDRKSDNFKQRNPSFEKSFVGDTASKIKRSPTVIREEVRIARDIDEDVKRQIKDTPIADRKGDLLSIAKMSDDKQKKIGNLVEEGKLDKLKIRIKKPKKFTVHFNAKEEWIDSTFGRLVIFDKTPDTICCPHFYELKWSRGCVYDCAWCYLNGTYRFLEDGKKPVNYNWEDVQRDLEFFFDRYNHPNENIVFNTGELSDSLWTETMNEPFSKFVIPIFERQKKHKVLFLTKSDRVDNLLDIKKHDQVIMSFSLNAFEVANRWEKRAPSVEKRIEAAKKLKDAGYEVRIRIDPIVPIEDWKRHYEDLVDYILERFIPDRVTLGSLRALQSTVNNCDDKSWVEFCTEKSDWGKRIETDMRITNFKTIIKSLRDRGYDGDIGLCKEPKELWEKMGMKCGDCKCNCIL